MAVGRTRSLSASTPAAMGEMEPAERSLLFRSTEAARERTVLRYLHAWRTTFRPAHLDRPAFPRDGLPDGEKPESCKDTALAAFAQLTALRLQCRRCFVTLLGSTVEYMLVESTRSLSLQYDTTENAHDELWIGTSSCLREEGLNGAALVQWQRARHLREAPLRDDFYYREGVTAHYAIYSDLTDNNASKDMGFLDRGPRHRFFFSVPLRDPRGGVIGALTVLDDKPRYGISAAEMSLAEEMADTCVKHLENTVVRVARRRAAQQIQGLSLFNQGKWSLREWWIQQEKEGAQRGGRHLGDFTAINAGDQERADDEFGSVGHDSTHATLRKGPATEEKAFQTKIASDKSAGGISESAPDTATEDFGQSSTAGARREMTDDTAAQKTDTQRRSSGEAAKDLPTALRSAYAHATNLMREALGAEGVLVVDAASVVAKAGDTRSLTSDSQSQSLSDNLSATPSESGSSDSESSTGTCKVLGFSSRVLSSLSQSPAWRKYSLRRDRLLRLINAHPHGRIFNLSESGGVYSSSGDEQSSTAGSDQAAAPLKPITKQQRDGKYLGGVFVGARSIAFYPLRSNERWQSGIIVWSNDRERFFDPIDDLAYLAAFGHSLQSRIAQLEAAAESHAKGSFISTVSHELRSPLHGVLAGTEFLQESELTPFQQEMTHTVAMAARTLLDTVNNILDYSKISNLSRIQRAERVKADNARHQEASSAGDVEEMGVSSNVDVARLTEEVLESLVSAFRFQGMSRKAISPEAFEDDSADQLGSRPSKRVAVTLSVDKRPDWTARISPGSWTRVITNIVGNALKYTKSGSVLVMLAVLEADHNPIAPKGTRVRLTVQDTGVGMSARFLQQDAYKPFTQEDSHTAGSGLGLSIVKQIASDMGAKVRITSELGEGTVVVFECPLTFSRKAKATSTGLDSLTSISARRLHLLTLPGEHSVVTQPDAYQVVEALKDNITAWLGWEVSQGSTLPTTSDPVVHAIFEADLLKWKNDQPEAWTEIVSALSPHSSGLLVLKSSFEAPPVEQIVESSVATAVVHHPIGPLKLLRAFNALQRTPTTPRENGHTLPGAKTKEEPADPLSPTSPVANGVMTFRSTRPSAMRTDSESRRSYSGLSPLTSPSGPTGRKASFSVSDAGSTPGNPKALLVEDNMVNMKLLVALMQKLGYDYEVAHNGLEAVSVFSANLSAFSVILMDMSMPLLDGFAATALIRDIEKRTSARRTRIVAVTGVTNAKARQDALAAGVDEYLTKPISIKDIKAIMDGAGS